MQNSFLSKIAPVQALRTHEDGQTPPVTNMELFFDLVYVFAIIQLSHYLLEHQTWFGALQAAMLFAAVWWAWNYTAWTTNWLDPNHFAGRIVMICLMFCSLMMAVAIPKAFSANAALFAGAYITMALLRGGYMILLFRDQQMGENYTQLTLWNALAGAFWLAGVLMPNNRTLLWLIAVLVDYAAPYTGYWMPGRGSTAMNSWPLSGLHLLERNQQIFIIALGESILLLGGTLLKLSLTPQVVLAALVGFLIIVLLWWIYFVNTTEKGEEAFQHTQDQTSLARASLAYAHGIMVASAIVVAVAIELMVAHPLAQVHLPAVLITTLGVTFYLLGNGLFLRAVTGHFPKIFLIGIIAVIIIGFITLRLHATGLPLGVLTLGTLLGMTVVTSNE